MLSARGLVESVAPGVIAALAVLAMLSSTAQAARGDLDGQFGHWGSVTHPALSALVDFEVAADGSMALLARSAESDRHVLLKLRPDGRRDRAFGDRGIVELDRDTEAVSALAIAGGGELLVATQHRRNDGTVDSRVASYRLDGSLERQFASQGILELPGFAVEDLLIDSSQRVLVVSSRGSVRRFSADGEADPSWSSSPDLISFRAPFQLREGPEGIYVGRPEGSIYRLTDSGEIDPSFGDDGEVFAFGGDFEGAVDAGLWAALSEVTGRGLASHPARILPDGSRSEHFSVVHDFSAGLLLAVDRRNRAYFTGTWKPPAWPGRQPLGAIADLWLPNGGRAKAFGSAYVFPRGEGMTAVASAIDPQDRLLIAGDSADAGLGVVISRVKTSGGGMRNADADPLRDRRDRCRELPSAHRSGCPRADRPELEAFGGKRAFNGSVKAASPFCAEGMRVAVYRKRRGGSRRLVARGSTNKQGLFKIRGRFRKGRYRVKTPGSVRRQVTFCPRSNIVKVRVR